MAGLIEVEWSLSSRNGSSADSSSPSREALQALEFAQNAAGDFDQAFELRNEEREGSVPHFSGDEVIISAEPIRFIGYTAEHELKTVRIVLDLQEGSFGTRVQEARSRFAERSIDGHYAVKYLQPGIIDSEHACNAATEMILETKILMNLAPHPNISQSYAVNSAGIDSFLVSGRKSFFIITDRIDMSLMERIQQWRDGEPDSSSSIPSTSLTSSRSSSSRGPDRERLNARLEIAMDIASALVYLHSRKLVFYLRPDKVGFDTRYGRMKLCQFGQARQEGMATHARSLTKSDNMQFLAYTPPEVFCNGPTTTATDVYAFGMLLWEFMSLEQPFSGWDRANHFQKVVRKGERPEMPKTDAIGRCWPRGICELVQSCWDPHLRPTMKMAHDRLEMALLFEDSEEEKVKEDFRETRQGNHKTEAAAVSVKQPNNDDDTKHPENSGKARGVSRFHSENGSIKRLVLKGKPRRRRSHDDESSTAADSSFSTSVAASFAEQSTSTARARRKTPPGTRRGNSPAEQGTRRKKKPSSSRNERGVSPDKSTATASSTRRPGKKRGSSLRVSESTAAALNALMGPDADGKTRRIPVRSASCEFDGNSSLPILEACIDFRHVEPPRQPLTPPVRRKPAPKSSGRGTAARPSAARPAHVHPKTPRRNSNDCVPGPMTPTPSNTHRRRHSTDVCATSPITTTPPSKPRRRHSVDVGSSPTAGAPLRTPRRRHSTDAPTSPEATPGRTPSDPRPRRRQTSLTQRVASVGRGNVPSTPRGPGRIPVLSTPRTATTRRNNSDITPRLRRRSVDDSTEKRTLERSSSDSIPNNRAITDALLASAVGDLQISPSSKDLTAEEKRADMLAGIVGNISI